MTRHLLRGGLLAAALAAPAHAHVTISPGASRPADLQEYRVLVPNEQDDRDTVGVDVQLPAGVDFALAQAEPGWRATIIRSGDRPRIVRYRGGRIPPDGFFTFHFIVRNPVRSGLVTFKTLQRYEGETVRWIGTPDSDRPAPRVTLSEAATPVDVVSVHGERVDAARRAPARAAVASATTGYTGRDGLTLSIAIAALALAAAGLIRRRR